jgi:hypothetical protein
MSWFVFDISEDIIKTKFPHIQDWCDRHTLTGRKDFEWDLLNQEIQMPTAYRLELVNYYYENDGSYEITTKCECHRHWAHPGTVDEYEECVECEL